MTRHQPARPEQLDDDQAALYAELTGGPRGDGPRHFELTRPDGSLTGPFDAMLLAPALGGPLQALGAAIRFRSALPPRVRELAILQVAAHWDSAFERDAHQAVGRAAGLTEQELVAVATGQLAALGDPVEQVCAELVAAMLEGDVPDMLWDRAVPVVGEATVFELSTLVGYYATLALQLRVFRVEGEGRG